MFFLQSILRGINDVYVGKNGDFLIFFQSMKQVEVGRGQIRRIGWVIKKPEAELRHFIVGSKCPVTRGIFVQEQKTLVNFSLLFFLQNVL